MDQYGKISDPVVANYFNVSFDWSWKVFYGAVDEAVFIKAGEKVAFFSST